MKDTNVGVAPGLRRVETAGERPRENQSLGAQFAPVKPKTVVF